MIGRLAVVAAALVLLSGCGGGGTTSSPAPTEAATSVTTPEPPASYTVAQLKAALPTKGDVPGAVEIYATCPDEAKACEQYPDGLAVAEVDIEPASVAGAERVRDQATPLDFLAVQGQAYADAASATADLDQSRTANAPYVGDYEITQNGKTSRGTGEVGTLTIGRWSGATSARTEVSSDAPDDEGLLVASAFLVSGTNRVGVFTSLSAAGRDPQAAAQLAESLVREYISRLEAA